MPIKFCCTELEHATNEGDIIHNVEKNEFYSYGRPSFADDGDGFTDDMTETFRMRHCLFCGKRLAPPLPTPPTRNVDDGLFTIKHKCFNCGYIHNIDVCTTTVTCPECGYSEIDL